MQQVPIHLQRMKCWTYRPPIVPRRLECGHARSRRPRIPRLAASHRTSTRTALSTPLAPASTAPSLCSDLRKMGRFSQPHHLFREDAMEDHQRPPSNRRNVMRQACQQGICARSGLVSGSEPRGPNDLLGRHRCPRTAGYGRESPSALGLEAESHVWAICLDRRGSLRSRLGAPPVARPEVDPTRRRGARPGPLGLQRRAAPALRRGAHRIARKSDTIRGFTTNGEPRWFNADVGFKPNKRRWRHNAGFERFHGTSDADRSTGIPSPIEQLGDTGRATLRGIVSALGREFDFQRCDLFVHDGRFWFGEFSTYAQGGIGRSVTARDEAVASTWTLPRNGETSSERQRFWSMLQASPRLG